MAFYGLPNFPPGTSPAKWLILYPNRLHVSFAHKHIILALQVTVLVSAFPKFPA